MTLFARHKDLGCNPINDLHRMNFFSEKNYCGE